MDFESCRVNVLRILGVDELGWLKEWSDLHDHFATKKDDKFCFVKHVSFDLCSVLRASRRLCIRAVLNTTFAKPNQ